MRKVLLIGSITFLLSLSYVCAQEAPLESDSVKSVTLLEVTVKAQPYKKYNLDNISSSLRIQGEMLKTPQNIQIINASVLKDQLSLNLTESVTRNVSGTFREELHNGVSPDIYTRGGYISAQRNGVDLRPLLKGPIGDDVAIIESVEFIKGPSGFMNSIGDPAGSYNIITKKPTGTNRKTFRMIQGSFGLIRAEADLDGAVGEFIRIFLFFLHTGLKRYGVCK